jgi:hypothetical protein
MTTVLQPSARDRIRAQMERMRPTFTLMYCSEDPNENPASFKYEQRVFTLPPMKRVEISDLIGVPLDRAYDTIDGQKKPWRTKTSGREPKETFTMAPADKVVSHAIGLLWDQGVVLLTGADDATEIEEGTKRWRTARQSQDEKIVGAFHARMEDFVSDPRNKHLPRPLMGKLERASQARLDRFRLQDAGAPVGADLRCQADGCSYWSPDPAELAIHMRASHGGEAPVITADVVEIEKAQAERERKRAEKRADDLAKTKSRLMAEAAAEAAKED